MAEPTFKPRYSDARICMFIHSALEIFYSILKCLSNREEADSVVSLRKCSLLHYIQNEVLGFPYGKGRAAGEQGVGVGECLSCFLPLLRQNFKVGFSSCLLLSFYLFPVGSSNINSPLDPFHWIIHFKDILIKLIKMSLVFNFYDHLENK